MGLTQSHTKAKAGCMYDAQWYVEGARDLQKGR